MIVKVHMLAFHDYTLERPVIREVHIPDEKFNAAQDYNQQLELVFYYGQNDVQNIEERCSVSMGDVAELFGTYFLCCASGWKSISGLEFQNRIKMDRIKRCMAF